MEEENFQDVILQMKRFFSTRERCENEVIQYIRRKGLNVVPVNELVEAIKKDGLIDDERFAKNRIESRIHKGYGPLYIKNELKILKIKDDIISRSMNCIPYNEYMESAVQILEKKLPGLISRENAEEKLYSILKYRGFTDGHYREAMDAVKRKFPHWAMRKNNKIVIE